MLIRSTRQLTAILGSFIFVLSTILVLRIYDSASGGLPYIAGRGRTPTPDFVSKSSSAQDRLKNHSHDDDEDDFDLNVYGKPAHEVFSTSTESGKYFLVDFGDYDSLNPSILAHPTLEDTWILVAQQQRTDVPNTVWFAQLVCNAQFKNGKLTCIKSPLLLPIGLTTTKEGMCTGELTFLSFNVGPHDARAFYGPDHPFVMYGSQSSYNCFGLYVQDLRMVIDWGVVASSLNDRLNPFRKSTEIQRPPPWHPIEKNWFLFWDTTGQMYAHYDIYPKRVFAALSPDGTPGPDLSIGAAKDDEKCIARYMPKLPPTLESVHQATNSLSVTLCKRNDPTCKPNADNTFIMTIFQHKTFYMWHGVYEPYVMLFKQTAPFAIHGISQKPIWIHGRHKADRPEGLSADDPWDQTEMFYTTSISWKGHGQKYHGYIDDEIFIGFGIEDKRAAGIDVVVGDILDHLGLCSDTSDIVNPPIPDMNTGNPVPALGDGLVR